MKHLPLALALALRLIVATILLQTLYFKFTAAPESVYIFTTLHAEPFGRIASGIAELFASALILWPRTQVLGALLSLGVISGAIFSHLVILGIEVQGDNGLLFGLACLVFVCSGLLLFLQRQECFRQLKRVRSFGS
jgi:putative oxidoreductase